MRWRVCSPPSSAKRTNRVRMCRATSCCDGVRLRKGRPASRLRQLHRLSARGLGLARQAGPRRALRARAWRGRSGHCRPQCRPRPGDRANGQGRLLPCRPGVRLDPANLRPRRDPGRVRGPFRRAGRSAARWRPALDRNRGRPADPPAGGGPGRILD